MIHIDRSKVHNPFETNPGLKEKGKLELQKYQEFDKKQSRFSFHVYKSPEIRDALVDLFHGKCAYCESAIAATSPGDIEHYRPKSSVVESPDHPGYWWLVNTWDNMLSVCIDCGRRRLIAGEISGKSNRFPLENENERAFEPGQEVHEHPLLLNPTVDFPEAFLIFNPDGTVVSDDLRGQTTIAVLGLNRPALVERRALAIKSVRKLINDFEFIMKLYDRDPEDAVLQSRLNIQLEEIRQQTVDSAEYAGAKRQFLKPFIERIERGVEFEIGIPDWETSSPKITKQRIQRAKRSTEEYQMEMSDYSLNEETGVEKYRLQRRFIERITMRNIRSIKELDLDLTNLSATRSPWLMLLGENGTGKSTVLQAIALVLVGADYFGKLVKRNGIHPTHYLRYRCRSGSVRVKLSGFHKPHELIFYRDRVSFLNPIGDSTTIYFGSEGETSVEGKSWEPQTVLLGYGATRLLPRHPQREPYGGDFARVDNLFDPFRPLFDANSWLLSREPKEFDLIALALKDLLSLDEEDLFIKERQDIYVRNPQSKVSLKQMSDGYQTMVATTVDILEVARRLWPNLEDAEGIVLLDEIGAHLHPRWKMKIVASLRQALPGMQFIATTHQPLCLRGLLEGEVVVMQKDEDNNIVAISDLPSPSDFRVDQLLTSEFFGLNSTIDPDVEKLFDEYYALLALKEPDEDEAKRLETLRTELKDRRYLGNTQRENLMYEAIDQLIAQQKTSQRQPLPDVKQAAVDQVSRVWMEAVNQDRQE